MVLNTVAMQLHCTKLLTRLQIILVLFFSIGSTSVLISQQQISLSQYDNFNGLYNPAAMPQSFVLRGHHLSMATTMQTQWTELSSAPRTQALAVDYATDTDNTFNMLAGGYIVNDRAGAISTTEMAVRLGTVMSNYDPTFGGFSAGLKIGMVNYRVDTERLHERYPNDILTAQNVGTIRPSIGVGLGYHKYVDKGSWQGLLIQTGISASQVTVGKAAFVSGEENFSIIGRPHFYAFANIRKSSKNGSALGASVITRYVKGAPFNADFSLSYQPLPSIQLQAGTSTAGIGLAGVNLYLSDLFSVEENLLVLTYSFRPTLFNGASFFGNSHELGVRYSL